MNRVVKGAAKSCKMTAPPVANLSVESMFPAGREVKRGLVPISLTLAGCVTPARMHTEAQLNEVATGCGLALGELMQDEEQKKLLADDPAAGREPTSSAGCVVQMGPKEWPQDRVRHHAVPGGMIA